MAGYLPVFEFSTNIVSALVWAGYTGTGRFTSRYRLTGFPRVWNQSQVAIFALWLPASQVNRDPELCPPLLITAFEKNEYYVPNEDNPIPKYQLFPFARNDVLLSRPYPVVTQPPSHAEGRQLYLAISYVQERMIRYFCPYTELPIIKLDDDKVHTLFRQRLARIKSSLVYYRDCWHGSSNCPEFATMFVGSFQSKVYRVADKGGIPGHVLQMLTKDWLLPLDEITAILMDVPIPFDPDTCEGKVLLLYAPNKTLDDFTPPASAKSSSKVKSSVKGISARPKPKAGASSTAKSAQTPLSPTKPALPKTKETSPVVPTIPKKHKAAPSNKDQMVKPDLPKKKAAREEKTSQIPKNIPAKGKATPKTKAKDKSASIASSQLSASVSVAKSVQPGHITHSKPAPSSASNEVEVTEPPSKMLPGVLFLVSSVGKGNECTPCLNDKGHFGGCQTLLDTLGRSLKLAEQARQRIVDDFVSFRNANMDPNLFFQYLICGRREQDEPLELDFNSVSFYATVFGWDSSLNFNSVIEDRLKVSEWLKKHSINLVYYEGSSAEVPESILKACGDKDNAKSAAKVQITLAT
ncbi:hypothetical protein BT96DRAFT_1089688 [Gymnopus androsaceus JB14]|uniref:Uncharacterized protein n=1 Tax=Gymnopus androsaceus JB14 TaxID=1447944 RepID=A0A6A4HY85_9AGAR|nr:hypothetical protein BT96DRAFT_1089688 [Gymnopus androsaceus JB14]